MPLYEFECSLCLKTTEEHRRVDDRNRPAMCSCGGAAARVVEAPASPTFGPGRSAESQADHRRKLKETLTRRSLAYDRSPRGREERHAAVERQVKNGNL